MNWLSFELRVILMQPSVILQNQLSGALEITMTPACQTVYERERPRISQFIFRPLVDFQLESSPQGIKVDFPLFFPLLNICT